MKNKSTPNRGKASRVDSRQQAQVMEMANAIMAANGLVGGTDVALERDTGSNKPGVICMANEERFVEANFSQPLTTYAVGWADPSNLDAALAFFAPEVPTTPRFEFARAVNAEEFMAETNDDDIRGIGGSFKRVEYTSEKVNAKVFNKGLTIRVDMDNVASQQNWRQIYTAKLIRRLKRAELRRAIVLLAAAATNTAVTWDTTAGKDPDQDVIDRLIVAGDSVGISLNRLGYGIGAWAKRRRCYRSQNNAGGYASANLSPDEVAGVIGVDQVYVSKERYQSTSTSKSRFVGDIALAFYAEGSMTPEDPSNIKRFTCPTIGGQPIRVYEQIINAKLVDITVEHYSNIIVTSTLGVQKLTVS